MADISINEVRLRIAEVLIPSLSKHAITNDDAMIARFEAVERYVLQSQVKGADKPRSPPQRSKKGPSSGDKPAFLSGDE